MYNFQTLSETTSLRCNNSSEISVPRSTDIGGFFQGATESYTPQDATIRVLTYRRYANITDWYFFVFSGVPRRYVELLLWAYLLFAGAT
jgi:hypothetical protein